MSRKSVPYRATTPRRLSDTQPEPTTTRREGSPRDLSTPQNSEKNANSGSAGPSQRRFGSKRPPENRFPPISPTARRKSSPVRPLLESLIVLALAVTMFRTFVLEGFMISTGSMAPALWGYHHRLNCPDCGFLFSLSATESLSHAHALAQQGDEQLAASSGASEKNALVCPNCQYQHVPFDPSIIHEGDQLLVDKQAFLWLSPQRWNSVVFKNPHHPLQAYAKRIIGLPGEVISLRGGDVYVRDVIQRKSLAEQRELRIIVSDSRHQPQLQDDNWQSRWKPQLPETVSAWKAVGGGFHFEPPAPTAAEADASSPPVEWLHYRNWIRQGGSLRSSVTLQSWPVDVPLPTPEALLQYDDVKKKVTCRAALPASVLHKLRSLSKDAAFLQAIEELFEKSHQQPITDQLAYNQQRGLPAKNVRDLMLVLDLEPKSLQSQLMLKMSDGEYPFLCLLDFATRSVQLKIEGNETVLRKGTLPELPFEMPVHLEMSLFDSQVLLAVNDQLCFEPYAYRGHLEAVQPTAQPISLAALGAPLNIQRLRVYRDVYYRNLPRPALEDPGPPKYRLGPEELFVLGDNSAVSVDSRHWPAGSLTQSLLIGRPVLLHLPSQKQTLQCGPFSTSIRVPDLKRVRLIR